MDGLAVRRARAGDEPAIATVHVAAWREAYAGLLPARLLGSLSVAEAIEKWRPIVAAPPPAAQSVFVALRPDRTLAGFGSCGPQRAANLIADGFGGEVLAIYLLAADQRQGLGRRLMAAMAQDLIERGLVGGALWVLRDNRRARRFYEALGGGLVGTKVEVRGEAAFHEVAYGWPDLKVLASA